MKRIWINRSFILEKSWKVAGSIYAIIGLAGMLANLDELIFPSLGTFKRVCIGIGILLAILLIVLVFCSIYYKSKDKISVLKILNKQVYVTYGDIFSEKIVYSNDSTCPQERRNLIIPVNCCFDTIIDDDLIASKKIHGEALKRLYISGRYDQDSLNAIIQKDLASRGISFTTLSNSEKRKGNLKRFPFGTIVEIDADEKTRYYLVALTELNSSLHAEIHNIESYVIVLQRIIEYISSRSQNFPTVMPIIGGGLPEICDKEQVMLELMIKLIKLNKDRINCDLYIVVRESGKNDIPILTLQ